MTAFTRGTFLGSILGNAMKEAWIRLRNAGKTWQGIAITRRKSPVRALRTDFHSYLPKVFKRAVGAA